MITSYTVKIVLETAAAGYAFNNLIATHSEYNTPFQEWIDRIRYDIENSMDLWIEAVAHGKAVLESDGKLVGYITGYHTYTDEDNKEKYEAAMEKIRNVFAEYLHIGLNQAPEILEVITEELTPKTYLPAYQETSFYFYNTEAITEN